MTDKQPSPSADEMREAVKLALLQTRTPTSPGAFALERYARTGSPDDLNPIIDAILAILPAPAEPAKPEAEPVAHMVQVNPAPNAAAQAVQNATKTFKLGFGETHLDRTPLYAAPQPDPDAVERIKREERERCAAVAKARMDYYAAAAKECKGVGGPKHVEIEFEEQFQSAQAIWTAIRALGPAPSTPPALRHAEAE